MPKISRETAQVDDYGPVEDRHGEIGDYSVSFVSFREDIDATPLLKFSPTEELRVVEAAMMRNMQEMREA